LDPEMQNTAHRSEKGEELEEMEEMEELVTFGMDLSQLNDYLNNIIKVVNQHAALLNTLNSEV
jgi:hypothetical protein